MRLDGITDWIDAARTSRYCLEELATRQCGVSVRHLRRYFAVAFRRSPQTWLDEVRLWDAAELLCSKLTVKEVAVKVSFPSVAHFCRRFKQYFGCTPSAFVRIETERQQRAGAGPQNEIHPPWVIARHILNTRMPRSVPRAQRSGVRRVAERTTSVIGNKCPR